MKVVQVSGARGRRYRENAGGWSRGAGLRTVFESLYGVAMRIRLKTIEAWWLARFITGEAMWWPEPATNYAHYTPSQGSANRSASEGVLGAMARPAPVSPIFNSF